VDFHAPRHTFNTMLHYAGRATPHRGRAAGGVSCPSHAGSKLAALRSPSAFKIMSEPTSVATSPPSPPQGLEALTELAVDLRWSWPCLQRDCFVRTASDGL
jgi:hypothetical protein